MQTIYLKSPMKEEFKKYIKKEEYNPDINKTEIWIGNFSNDPTIDPIITIFEIISHFQNQDNKIIIDDKYIGDDKTLLIFEDITFNECVVFVGNSFNEKVWFLNCTFVKHVSFENCIFKDIFMEIFFVRIL